VDAYFLDSFAKFVVFDASLARRLGELGGFEGPRDFLGIGHSIHVALGTTGIKCRATGACLCAARLPDRVRVAIGFTSAGRRSRAIRECWDNRRSADGHFEIFIRRDLAHALDAMTRRVWARPNTTRDVLLPQQQAGESFQCAISAPLLAFTECPSRQCRLQGQPA
jgi:hypothetical protein